MLSQKPDISNLLNLSNYTNRDTCRATITLRNHEQGYMNGRMLSLNKQIKYRDEVLENEMQIDTKLSEPIYRLLLSKDTKLQDLARRLKIAISKLSTEASPSTLKQLYALYTKINEQEDGLQIFYNQVLKIFSKAKQEDIYDLWGLFSNIEEMYDRIMITALCDETNLEIPIHEYGFFDQDYQSYQDPYNLTQDKPNIQLELYEKEKDQEEEKKTVEIGERKGKNYVSEFFAQHGQVILAASQQYWELLLFDILREISNSKLSNSELETRLFGMLKNIPAVKYLLRYRKEIVIYMNQTKFWSQEKKIQNKHQGDLEQTNHQILEKLGVGEMEIEKKLGLKEQKYDNDGKQRRRKQMMNQDELQLEHNPDDYIKMDNEKLKRYFPTCHREDLKEYLKIRIDPIPKPQAKEQELICVKNLPEWIQKAFDNTDYLNTIQSKIYERAFLTEENLLICAPTGAGKTNVALLSILQELSRRVDQETFSVVDHNFKIVYISPMKALASEIVDKFSSKLKYLGVKVREYTGDMQLSKKELQETHIILTTPEKWDVITRKTNNISDQLQLLIIDEIHLLNDDRGPILECVVARTVKQVERAQRVIRLVGLSATLPNYWDVAEFLQVRREGVFFFDQTYRPVPLCQKFVGIKEPVQLQRQRRTKKDVYDECCYDILREVLRHNKQVLVFVHSRKETVRYARFVIERGIAKNESIRFTGKKDYKTMTKEKDTELNKCLIYGCAFHHAGMLRSDRNLVERLFLQGDIRVLIATATLAWGVNLPAYAVIIKGTEVFDPSRADMQNLSVLDVQQMFGRAGRPQFDSQGEATLITDHGNVGHYMALLNNASYIESRLMRFLKEALNAEIVLGNVLNYNEAYDWLKHTFFSIRLRRNPLMYGVDRQYGNELDCDFLVEDKINNALQELDDLRMIRYDKRNQLVASTELGRIGSHYYIKCETMRQLCESMGITFDQGSYKYEHKSQYQLLRIMSKAKEFEVIRVRPEEMKELADVLTNYWIFDQDPIDINLNSEDESIETEEKVIALISGYIAQVKYENYALIMDTHVIIQNAIRIARCMLEMAIKKNQAQIANTLLRLCKLIENRMAERSTPLQQFSKEIFAGYNSRKMHKDSKEGFINQYWLDNVNNSNQSVQDLLEANNSELCHLLNSNHTAVQVFRRYCSYLPQVNVQYVIKPIAQSILRIEIQVQPDFKFSHRWHMKNELFRVFVDNEEEILHAEEFIISQKQIEENIPAEISFFIPNSNKQNESLRLIVTSDRWIMREDCIEYINLSEHNIEQDLIDFTNLLDLQPLPKQVVGEQFESLYPFAYFNPIQTQVFFSLFHTDDNVLIGAPTGSGKTYMAEFAMIRVFLKSPDKKVVYIAPMKAIAKERLKDWNKRLKNKSVLELTGDYTPDLEALLSADVLITTPEKWDGISRNWTNRNYVSQTALLIFDEIHLLGQDRGPVLEVIVSRMNLISEKKGFKTRMIGLSTAMANGSDVAQWFGVKKHRFYNFKPSCRPVPVTIHFNGFSEKAYCPRMATMNKPAFQDIKRHSDGKPVIVFVSSRRQTRLTAMDLIALSVHSNSGHPEFLKCQQWEIQNYQEQVKDEYLNQTLGFGIGMHHAGLTSEDRNIVEELFVNNKIQVLVATSTLAWGVNFPARLVILKGTEYFHPKMQKYVDMPVTDLLQMIGRAGRPQFDNQATACVYVEQSKKDFYRKYLNDPFPIESQLLTQLTDHINAEIAAGTIINSQQCIDWLTWTYFFRRILKNPKLYGCENSETKSIKQFLIKLVDENIRRLKLHSCITVSEDNTYSPTFLGYLASFYYVKHETILHFSKSKENSVEDLLKTLSYAKEFEEVPMRHNEDNMNEALSKICPLKSDQSKMDSAQEKTFLLLQAHIFRLPVPIRDFVTDKKIVIDSSVRMIHAMMDVAAEQKDLKKCLNLALIMQMIIQGIWFDQSPLINVPGFTPEIVQKLKKQGINYLCELIHYKKLKELVPEDTWSETEQAINQVPIIDMKCQLQYFNSKTMEIEEDHDLVPGGEAVMIANINRINHQYNQRVSIQKLSKVKDASWWLIVGYANQVLALKKIYFKKYVRKQLQIPIPPTLNDDRKNKISVYLLSDSYLGIDQLIEL